MSTERLAITLESKVVKQLDEKRGLAKRSTYINYVLSKTLKMDFRERETSEMDSSLRRSEK